MQLLLVPGRVTLALVALLIAVALFRPPRDSARWRAVERAFARLASRRRTSLLVVAVFVLAWRAAVHPLLGIPVPSIFDEFGHLLAAETYSLGRLTNAPHPLWVQFETFFVLHHPTYMSIYPVAQGLILAAGKLIGGHYWFGVWASVAAMCAAICWMLQGWLPPRWALLGGLIAAMRIGVFDYWMNSYWGGAAAAIGGAMILGALPRIKRHLRVRDALIMGAGLALLANSRPYEGLILGAIVCGGLLVWIARRGTFAGRWCPTARVILPILLVLIPTAMFMAFYFYRLTGDPLRNPYQVNRNEYAIAPIFVFLPPAAAVPAYRHAVMRDYYVNAELTHYADILTARGFLADRKKRIINTGVFFLSPALLAPLIWWPWVFRDRRIRFLLVALGLFMLAMSVQSWWFMHYAAPATALIYALVMQCMRHMRTWRSKTSRAGVFLVRSVVVICLIRLVLQSPAQYLRFPFGLGTARQFYLEQLEAMEGRHLVIVRYNRNHYWEHEWVYNGADIDSAKVVWAREIDAASNERLVHYFSDRRVWLAEPDLTPPAVAPYPHSRSNCRMRMVDGDSPISRPAGRLGQRPLDAPSPVPISVRTGGHARH